MIALEDNGSAMHLFLVVFVVAVFLAVPMQMFSRFFFVGVVGNYQKQPMTGHKNVNNQ